MNILVTGSNGYIGSSIINKSKNNKNHYFHGSRENINLLDKNNIIDYIKRNKIDSIIHCAIKGGNRTRTDSESDFYDNLLISENILCVSNYVNKIINIASGAEYDRTNDIKDFSEDRIFIESPKDYYGLAKNLIAKRFYQHANNTFNIRVFGCFDENELDTRFIKSCIINNRLNKKMQIHEDKIMDFIYFDDLLKIINYILFTENPIQKDLNASYSQKLKLSEIAYFINNINREQVEILIEKHNTRLNYYGNSNRLDSLNLRLDGLTTGIIKTNSKINENIYRWT